MNFSIFLKVFAELCLYFGIIGALPGLFPHSIFFLWPSVVCAAGAGIAAFLSDHGKSKHRFFLLIPAAAPLMLGRTVMDYLVLIPPVVYASFLIIRDMWDLEYFSFRDGFRKNLIIFGIGLMLVHCGVLIESRSDWSNVLDSLPLLRQLLLYALSGILLQRQLRLGIRHERSWRMNGIQLFLTVLFTAALLLGIVAAERFLSARGLSLGQLAGHALQVIVGVPMALFQSLFHIVSEMIKTAQSLQQDPLSNSDIDPTPVMPMEEMQQLLEQTPQEKAPYPWWLAILVLVALTLLMLFMTRMLRSRPAGAVSRETVTQLAPKAKEPRRIRRTNRQKLRRIYREFLKAEKRKGRKLHPWHTSQDILDGAWGDTHAASLRDLYLSARYDLSADITAEQVQSAKDALRQYKTE